jgi:hypothetical protein
MPYRHCYVSSMEKHNFTTRFVGDGVVEVLCSCGKHVSAWLRGSTTVDDKIIYPQCPLCALRGKLRVWKAGGTWHSEELPLEPHR